MNTQSSDTETKTTALVVATATPLEFRKKYLNLIHNCPEWDEEMEQKTNNIAESEQIRKVILDLSFQYLHVKEISAVVRKKPISIANNASGFGLDKFINFLRENHTEMVGTIKCDYSVLELSSKVVIDRFIYTTTVPCMISMIPTLDKAAITMGTCPPQKFKKKRAAPWTFKFDITKATDPLEFTSEHSEYCTKYCGKDPIKHIKDKLKLLEFIQSIKEHIAHIENTEEEMGFYYFTMGKNCETKIMTMPSLPDLLREGYFSIKRRGDDNFFVNPEAPPTFIGGKKLEKNANILHCSPIIGKSLAQASQGEGIITEYNRNVQFHADPMAKGRDISSDTDTTTSQLRQEDSTSSSSE